jgi:hypothetical protein
VITDRPLSFLVGEPFMTITPNELQVLKPRFWEGSEKALLSSSYPKPLFLHARGLLPDEYSRRIGEALEIRTLLVNAQRPRFTDCTTMIGDLASIVPATISNSFVTSNHPTPEHLATLAGVFSTQQISVLKNEGVPSRRLPGIYRKLIRAHLQYQHENWATRNKSVRDKDRIVANR